MLGLVFAFASVVFDMAAKDRAAGRMLRINGAFRQAVIQIGQLDKVRDAVRLGQVQAADVKDHLEAVERDILENQKTIENLQEATWYDKLLVYVTNPALAVGVLCFIYALMSAIWTGDIRNALCTTSS